MRALRLADFVEHEAPGCQRGLCYTRRMPTFHVVAHWDPEAKVWIATSEDVLGLATEAPTFEALAAKLRIMIPELLVANRLLGDLQSDEISYELTSHCQEQIRLAS